MRSASACMLRFGAHQRIEPGRMCRYITRPAIASDRLKRNRAGQVVLQLKSPYRDGATHIVMWALQFMQRPAALVPRPHLHLIRVHGVLAPNASSSFDKLLARWRRTQGFKMRCT